MRRELGMRESGNETRAGDARVWGCDSLGTRIELGM